MIARPRLAGLTLGVVLALAACGDGDDDDDRRRSFFGPRHDAPPPDAPSTAPPLKRIPANPTVGSPAPSADAAAGPDADGATCQPDGFACDAAVECCAGACLEHRCGQGVDCHNL